MTAPASDYFAALLSARDQMGFIFGTDIAYIPNDKRFLADANLAVFAAVTKALVDAGAVTDGAVQTALNDAVSGADGSTWTADPGGPVPIFDYIGFFPGETFESGTAGAKLTAANTEFVSGQAGDSLLASTGSIVFDSTHYGGSLAMKATTLDGWSRAMRTGTYFADNLLFVRFYFRAAAAPATGGCRIYAAQLNPDGGTGLTADSTVFELAVDSSGIPHMYDHGTDRLPGSTPPSICDGTWWRVEATFSNSTTQCELRLYGGANVSTTTITFSWTATYSGDATFNSVLVGQPGSALTSGQTWATWFDNVDFATSGGWIGP
jgi:hypothetical protein